jgi:hypothetical protein
LSNRERDRSVGVVLFLGERLLREMGFDICRCCYRAHQLLLVHFGSSVLVLDLADSELLRERR